MKTRQSKSLGGKRSWQSMAQTGFVLAEDRRPSSSSGASRRITLQERAVNRYQTRTNASTTSQPSSNRWSTLKEESEYISDDSSDCYEFVDLSSDSPRSATRSPSVKEEKWNAVSPEMDNLDDFAGFENDEQSDSQQVKCSPSMELADTSMQNSPQHISIKVEQSFINHDPVKGEALSPTMSTSNLSLAVDVKPKVEPSVPGTLGFKVPKGYSFHRFMVCEWFYSDIDRVLLAEGSDKRYDFAALVAQHFPALQRRPINRAELNHIRKKLKSISGQTTYRRCSEKFFLDERTRLELRRDEVRYLQMNPMFECLSNGVPMVIPKPITINCVVRAQLIKPTYGIFDGIVVGVHEQLKHVFLVDFGEEFGGEQYVEDFRLKRLKDPQVEELLEETVTMPQKLYNQMLTLRDMLTDKRNFLEQMAHLRISTEWRIKNGKPTSCQDRENALEYLATIKQLVLLDRAICRQEVTISSLYAVCMGEAAAMDDMTASPPQFIESDVVEAAEDLITGEQELCQQLHGPITEEHLSAVDQLCSTAVERLRHDPAKLDQLRCYVQSSIGSTAQ